MAAVQRIAGFQPALLWPGAMPPPQHMKNKAARMAAIHQQAAQTAALRETAGAAGRQIDSEVLRNYNTRIQVRTGFVRNYLKINA